MFIPNEGALQLMRSLEPSLWYEAYDQKVIITSDLSLFSLLKMIENYWAQVQQQRNQDKIIKAAENMLDRMAALYDLVDDVEKAFKNVENKFESVKSKMLVGRQSIATSARQVIESGVKSQRMEERLNGDTSFLIEQ
jgi:DNA anti-recombination protein RmuC